MASVTLIFAKFGEIQCVLPSFSTHDGTYIVSPEGGTVMCYEILLQDDTTKMYAYWFLPLAIAHRVDAIRCCSRTCITPRLLDVI